MYTPNVVPVTECCIFQNYGPKCCRLRKYYCVCDVHLEFFCNLILYEEQLCNEMNTVTAVTYTNFAPPKNTNGVLIPFPFRLENNQLCFQNTMDYKSRIGKFFTQTLKSQFFNSSYNDDIAINNLTNIFSFASSNGSGNIIDYSLAEICTEIQKYQQFLSTPEVNLYYNTISNKITVAVIEDTKPTRMIPLKDFPLFYQVITQKMLLSNQENTLLSTAENSSDTNNILNITIQPNVVFDLTAGYLRIFNDTGNSKAFNPIWYRNNTATVATPAVLFANGPYSNQFNDLLMAPNMPVRTYEVCRNKSSNT